MRDKEKHHSVLDGIQRRFLSGDIDKYQYSRDLHSNHMGLFDYARWLEKTGIKEIKIGKNEVSLLTDDGLLFPLDMEDQYLPPTQLLNFGDYERPERDLLFRIVKPGMTVFDIGANIGWYSLLIAQKMPQCKLLAFEPIPSTCRRLSRNVELNRLSNITVYNHGLSDSEEEKIFYFAPEISGAASGANILGWDTVRTEKCRVRRMDDVWRENALRVDFIKCDVEGAELFVFRGGAECLASDKPVIFCEMLRKWSAKFSYHPNQIVDMLKELGYSCHAVGSVGIKKMTKMDESTEETNFIFFHDISHACIKENLAADGLLL